MLTARLVHFYPGGEPFPGGPRDCDQPLAALVLRDNEDSTVALKVFAPNGEDFYRSRVIYTDLQTCLQMKGSSCCLPESERREPPLAAGLGSSVGGGAAGWGGQFPAGAPAFVPPRGSEGGGEGGSAPAETAPAAPTEPAEASPAPTAAETSPATNAGVTV